VWVFSSPLWKRGARGDFINKSMQLKSPCIPLFQRGINLKAYLTPKKNLPTHFHDEPLKNSSKHTITINNGGRPFVFGVFYKQHARSCA
jgi:hypothetical protein